MCIFEVCVPFCEQPKKAYSMTDPSLVPDALFAQRIPLWVTSIQLKL